MTIYSTKHGYRFDITVKGKRHTGSGYASRKEALAKQEERRKEVLELIALKERGDMGLLDLFGRRLESMEQRNFSKSYRKNTRYAMRRLLEYVNDNEGDTLCSHVTDLLADEFLLDRRKQSGAAAANDDLRLLRATFTWGRERGQRFIDFNPFMGLKAFPSDDPDKEVYTPDAEDLDRVIEAARDEDKDYLWTLRETMARSVEVHRLTWDDVDFKKGVIRLMTRKNKQRKPVYRKIPMTAKLREVLWARYDLCSWSKGWVFTGTSYDKKTGQAIEGPYKGDRNTILKRACIKAGVTPFTLHRIRASGASMMLKAGVPVTAIQSVLGHGNLQSTFRYLAKLRDGEVEAMEAFEEISRAA